LTINEQNNKDEDEDDDLYKTTRPAVNINKDQVISEGEEAGELDHPMERPMDSPPDPHPLTRGATTSSKLGVQFLGLRYHYTSTERN